MSAHETADEIRSAARIPDPTEHQQARAWMKLMSEIERRTAEARETDPHRATGDRATGDRAAGAA